MAIIELFLTIMVDGVMLANHREFPDESFLVARATTGSTKAKIACERNQISSREGVMDRRSFNAAALAAIAGTASIRHAAAQGGGAGSLDAALQTFMAFPGAKAFRIDVGDDTVASESASSQEFVASAIKTFVLCQYLREVEAGLLSEDEQLAINDAVRTTDSPVFGNLAGTTTARSVLEAMITHSDNTATDVALARVGPDRVRALVAEIGLQATLIPDSTRRFVSYNLGPRRVWPSATPRSSG